MAYKALYRTYRPQTFEEVVGQEIIVKTLQNSIRNKKISHAYLFCGPRGTGKTSIARIFAKALNCPNTVDAKPCNECAICDEITKGTSPDVIEIDAASNNGVDEIRELKDKVKFLPAGTKYKVYIIDEVHMLSTSAFNALLKTLEEPPQHAIFILATTEPHKVLPTIISRCQRYDFKALTNEEIYNRLALVCDNENVKYNKDSLMSIAVAADGGMRDALSFLDQAISLCDDEINDEVASSVTGSVDKANLLTLANYLEEKKISDALKLISNLQNNGRDTSKIIVGLLEFYRDILMCKAQINGSYSENYKEFSEKIDIRKVYFNIDVLNDVQGKIKFTTTPNIYLEVAVIKMINASQDELDYGKRIYELEQKIENYTPGEGGASVDSNDLRRIRMIEEKFNNLLTELGKLDLFNLTNRVKALENAEPTEKVENDNVKDIILKVNRIVEDLELLKVTQDSLRTQLDNTASGGIDDSILNERIENGLKKYKPTVNYSEIEGFVNKKIDEFKESYEIPESTYVQSGDNSESLDKINLLEDKINLLEDKLNNLDDIENNEVDLTEVYNRISRLENAEPVVATNSNVDLTNVLRRLDALENKENTYVQPEETDLSDIYSRLERIERSNSYNDNNATKDVNLDDVYKRIEELENSFLENNTSSNLPVNLDSRLAKMESNIYKIMSGMLNPQSAKKPKSKVDNKQISLWNDDIVDFGKIAEPTDNSKTDFGDFSKEEKIENISNEVVNENVEEKIEIVEEPSQPVEENIFDDEQIETETIINDEPSYENQFEEDLGDFFSDEEKNEVVSEPVQVVEENIENIFNSDSFENKIEEAINEENKQKEPILENSNEVQEETIEEPILEPSQEEIVRLEEEKAEALRKEQELEQKRREEAYLEEQRHLQKVEQERLLREEERLQKEQEIQKLEQARASGGDDLDEYERYDVKVLERILNDSRNPEYADDKGRLERVWRELVRLAPVDKRGIAEILSEGKVQAVGNHEFVLLYNNAAICNQVMNRRFKRNSLKLLYDILGTDYNYFAITQEVFLEKRQEYSDQYCSGTKYPTLTPITDPNLRVVLDEDGDDIETMKKKAADLFGSSLSFK